MSQLRFGVHAPLEDAATELIRKSLEGVTSMSEKSDVLTTWKEADRRRREVYASSGIPDGALRRGMYHRAWNSWHPDLNSVDGKVRVESLDGGCGALRVAHDEDLGVRKGGVYNLMLNWGNQARMKCPGCSRFFRDAPEVNCVCGTVMTKRRKRGHYQIARLP